MGERSTAVQRAEEPAQVKPIQSENPFEGMSEVFDAISRRAFELFESNGRIFGHEVEDWFKAENELLHPAPIDITETGESVEVKVEVPGFSEKELEVNVEPHRLTITGKREASKEEKKGKTVYSETRSDQVFRVLDLPAEVQAEKAAATLKNGMLQLTMPKAAKTRTVRVQPKAVA
jgi:HSP20 family protein